MLDEIPVRVWGAALVLLLAGMPLAAADRDFAHETSPNSFDDLAPALRAKITGGEAWYRSWKGEGGVTGAEGYRVLPYPVAPIWEVLTDLPSFARWKQIIRRVNHFEWISCATSVLDYDTSGLKSFRIVLEREHFAFERIEIRSREGLVKDLKSAYEFTPMGEGRTLVRYYSQGRSDAWVPNFLKRYVASSGVENDFDDIAAEVARRAEARQQGRLPALDVGALPAASCPKPEAAPATP